MAQDPVTLTQILATLLPAAASAAAGLLGVWVGVAATSRRERTARRHRFLEQQITEFYSPLTGLADEIDARLSLTEFIAQSSLEAVAARKERMEAIAISTQELRDKASRLSKEIGAKASRGEAIAGHIARLEELLGELLGFNKEIATSFVHGESYKKLASSIVDNRLHEIFPLLEESVRIFRERYWLAEESTRRHFIRFNQKVEQVRYLREDSSVTDLVPFEKLFGDKDQDQGSLLDDLRRNLTMLRSRLGDI